MIVPDPNLLLYAYNAHMPQHDAARRWWEGVMNSDELVGLPFEVAFGFVCVATNPRLGLAGVALADARRVLGRVAEGRAALERRLNLAPFPVRPLHARTSSNPVDALHLHS
jgi:predicted nucleic acid-binding protein